MNMIKKATFVLLLAGLWAACQPSDENACSPGQILDRNYCITDPEAGDGDAGDGDSGDGDSGDGDVGEGGAGGASNGDGDMTGDGVMTGDGDEGGISPEYGKVCADDTECAAPTTMCVKSPSAPEGYCSLGMCESESLECPEGWGCNVFIPGVAEWCEEL